MHFLCASAVTQLHSYTPNDSQYDKYGAGLVSAQQAYNVANANYYLLDSFPAGTASNTSRDYEFSFTSSKDRFRIALTWPNYKYIETQYVHSEVNPNSTPIIADLDLYIYDSSGNEVIDYSIQQKGSVEIIDIVNLPAGTYKISIKAYTGSSKAINYGLAWWY